MTLAPNANLEYQTPEAGGLGVRDDRAAMPKRERDMISGRVNPGFRLEDQGISGLGRVHYNLTEPALVDAAIRRGEGELGQGGALLVSTGEFTGRSPKDKFTVRTPTTENTIWWDNNLAMSPGHFDQLHKDMLAYLAGREVFVQDLVAGADPAHSINVRLVNELAWHNLFIRHMLRRPDRAALDHFVADYTVINCTGFKADPVRHGCRSETVIAVNIDARLILIGNTEYAGENKKSIFGLMNYLLPEKGVMPMHCSANHAKDDYEDAAVFFGLSGTGKTTLSADPNRTLLGDDEHGWSDKGTFNFEGGCYAKTIHLSPEAEPEIYATCSMFGTVIENMVYDAETRELDYEDASLTENMRCAYPLNYIPNASETGLAGHPRNVVMLTCDAFGVLPPIARLTPAQAMYHFLSGFTAKMAGTERGLTEPQPVFSTCFGAPFMPRRPEVYGNLLRAKIESQGASCWLVNSGWTGGAYGTGSRMPIKATRALLTAALDGSLNDVEFRKDPNFGFEVPVSVPGVADVLLDPRRTWDDAQAYDAQAARLVAMFAQNFEQYLAHVDADLKAVALG
ncbi:phosphoenolpyruvate carboxykinase (ATP) [Roseovarius sp. MBR-79]|jgi:phosphoenolpyruvate carboxykinase (ATP)